MSSYVHPTAVATGTLRGVEEMVRSLATERGGHCSAGGL